MSIINIFYPLKRSMAVSNFLKFEEIKYIRFAQADKMLEALTSLHPASLTILVLFTLVLAFTFFEAFRSVNWLKKGRKALDAKNLTAAITCLTKEIFNNPESAEAYQLRAEAYEQIGDTMKALQDKRMANQLLGDATAEEQPETATSAVHQLG